MLSVSLASITDMPIHNMHFITSKTHGHDIMTIKMRACPMLLTNTLQGYTFSSSRLADLSYIHEHAKRKRKLILLHARNHKPNS